MTGGCDGPSVAAAIRIATIAAPQQHVELTRLDREIGDGDHGENMNRGFKAVVAKLDADPGMTPGAILKLVAMTLMSTVGGASGPLYGTAFLRAATTVGDAGQLDAGAVGAALAAALGGVQARGKAVPGDKTIVDALVPAVEAAESARGNSVAEVLQAAAAAAQDAVATTIPLVARKGRASYLGERSAGHADPGATSTAVILRALAEAAKA